MVAIKVVAEAVSKMTRNLKYVVYQEDRFYVSQCLNVDVASFGETIDEAVRNLKEAVELYFGNGGTELNTMKSAMP